MQQEKKRKQTERTEKLKNVDVKQLNFSIL